MPLKKNLRTDSQRQLTLSAMSKDADKRCDLINICFLVCFNLILGKTNDLWKIKNYRNCHKLIPNKKNDEVVNYECQNKHQFILCIFHFPADKVLTQE